MPPVQMTLFGNKVTAPPKLVERSQVEADSKPARAPKRARKALPDVVLVNVAASQDSGGAIAGAADGAPPVVVVQAKDVDILAPKASDAGQGSGDTIVTHVGDADTSCSALAASSGCGNIMFSNPNVVIANVEPFCSKCGYTVDPLQRGVRLLTKTPQSFQCAKCNSKQVMLTQIFGTWPLADFKSLSDDVKQQFWRQTASDKTSLKKAVEHHLVNRLVETRLASEAGPFLPLLVWAQQGYDVMAIKLGAAMEMHPVLGETFQVKIHTTGHEKKQELIRDEMQKLTCNVGRKQQRQIDDASQAPGDGEGKCAVAVDNSSSSTGSSSSDSTPRKNKSKKHSKKSKKSKKDAKSTRTKQDKERDAAAALKAQVAASKMAEKAEKSRITKVKTEAGKVVAKVAPILVELEEQLKDANACKVPVVLTKKVQDSIKALKAFDEEARTKMQAKDPLDLTFGIEDVVPSVKEAIMVKGLMQNVLLSIGRL